ncbi:MAG: cysteine--tRNA ligase [Microgenomates group bacterium]
MNLYNTITRKIEKFQPLNPPRVTLYTCGPTVYDFTHIGHLRTYTNNDVLKRTLNYLGYQVKHVMNITDVGHLTGDDDTGEDKLEKGAKRVGKTVWVVAAFYTDFFFKSTDSLNILRPDIICRATDHIKEMIDLIQILEKKGYTYETKEALYFNVAKFKNYGRLSRQPLSQKLKGAREEVYIDPEKKHPADFALWFKRVGRFANHSMHWTSPWGDGFPGWHIECSAMSMKYLGETIDIHAGGVDHIPVHHENEIAQSEVATGKPFVRYWFHNNFLLVEGEKMSKSLGNFYTIDDIKKKNIEPAALRYLFLQSHYRQVLNFTWNSVLSAQEGYNKLKEYVLTLRQQKERTALSSDKLKKIDLFRQRFLEAVSNDLQTPQALSFMWEMLKSNIPSTDKLDLLLEFDQVLGLKLNEITQDEVPEEIIKLAKERQKARQKQDFEKADELRKKIQQLGWKIEDSQQSFKLKRLIK